MYWLRDTAARLTRLCSAFARIENHYFVNEVRRCLNCPRARSHIPTRRGGCVMDRSSRSKRSTKCELSLSFSTPDLIKSCSRHIPCVVVQGRYDVVCPVSWQQRKVTGAAR